MATQYTHNFVNGNLTNLTPSTTKSCLYLNQQHRPLSKSQRSIQSDQPVVVRERRISLKKKNPFSIYVSVSLLYLRITPVLRLKVKRRFCRYRLRVAWDSFRYRNHLYSVTNQPASRTLTTRYLFYARN